MLRYLLCLTLCIISIRAEGVLVLRNLDSTSLDAPTWRSVKRTIRQRMWVENKSEQAVRDEVNARGEYYSYFVPDSLIQLYGLTKVFEDTLRPFLERQEESPFRVQKANWPFGVLDHWADQEFSELLSNSRQFGKSPRRFDDRLLNYLRNSKVFKLADFVHFACGSSRHQIEQQRLYENNFWEDFSDYIQSKNWEEILNSLYPEHRTTTDPEPHFMNLVLHSETIGSGGFGLQKMQNSRSNLAKSVQFEQTCFDGRMIALLRGSDYTSSLEHEGNGDPPMGKVSLSFAKGFYSGLVNDYTACTANYSSLGGNLLLGIPVNQAVFSKFFFVTPFSWFQNLFQGGEFFHCRTLTADSSLRRMKLKKQLHHWQSRLEQSKALKGKKRNRSRKLQHAYAMCTSLEQELVRFDRKQKAVTVLGIANALILDRWGLFIKERRIEELNRDLQTYLTERLRKLED